MINVIASIYIKEGRLPEFVEIFKSNVPKVLEEDGCTGYVPTVDFPTDLPIQELNKDVLALSCNVDLDKYGIAYMVTLGYRINPPKIKTRHALKDIIHWF